MNGMRPIHGPTRLAALEGARALFRTVNPPSPATYPTEASTPTVYYARMLTNPSFPREVGNQTLSYDYTDKYDYIFNLEVEKYIEVGAVVLCFFQNGQWYTIDKVVQDDPYPCFSDMRRKSPLRMVVSYKSVGGIFEDYAFVTQRSFVCTMRWHSPTPTWLQTVTALHPDNIKPPEAGCPDTGVNLFGTGGVWLSDEEMDWTYGATDDNPAMSGGIPLNFNAGYVTSASGPGSPFDQQPLVRAFIAPVFGWAERQQACGELDLELRHDVRALAPPGQLGFGMVRTDQHYERHYITQNGEGEFDEVVYFSYASKMNAWSEFTCSSVEAGQPVYGFGFWPRYNLGTQNGVVGGIDPTTGLFVESTQRRVEYLLTEMP